MGIAALAAAGVLTACDPNGGKEEEGDAKKNAVPLRADKWAEGSLSSKGAQWYRFTPTVYNPYIHVTFGTLTDLTVTVYEGEKKLIQKNLYDDGTGESKKFNTIESYYTLSTSDLYYLLVEPADSYGHGDYKIAVSNSETAPY